jgi:hypothetical protein
MDNSMVVMCGSYHWCSITISNNQQLNKIVSMVHVNKTVLSVTVSQRFDTELPAE